MADTTKLLLQAQFTNADGLLGGPSGVKWQVSNVHICNTSNAAVTFRLHHSTSGASATTNALYYDTQISANAVLVEAPMVIEDGQTLRGLCSANAVLTLTLYGIAS